MIIFSLVGETEMEKKGSAVGLFEGTQVGELVIEMFLNKKILSI
jgi:hypothetical protein